MRGKKAKELRRKVYGDFSIREKMYRVAPGGQRVCVGRREKYLKEKKFMYAARRGGIKE